MRLARVIEQVQMQLRLHLAWSGRVLARLLLRLLLEVVVHARSRTLLLEKHVRLRLGWARPVMRLRGGEVVLLLLLRKVRCCMVGVVERVVSGNLGRVHVRVWSWVVRRVRIEGRARGRVGVGMRLRLRRRRRWGGGHEDSQRGGARLLRIVLQLRRIVRLVCRRRSGSTVRGRRHGHGHVRGPMRTRNRGRC